MLGEHLKLYFKCTIYYLAKALGLFKLANKLTKEQVRILCYHGGAIEDEHLYDPTVFISKERFKQQLQLINKYQFNVVPLESFVNTLKKQQCPSKSVVLTFDDGFYNTTELEPLLKEYGYPATLYVSTYYVLHQSPIFNVTLAYLFYKTTVDSFTLALGEQDKQSFTTKGLSKDNALETIRRYARTINEEQQNQLLRQISTLLNIELDTLWNKRFFHNMTSEELSALHQRGVFDIQLHTHRHNLPVDEEEFAYEIEKNKQALSEITGKNPDSLHHFCYPSGVWDESQFNLLKKHGIVSATTLDPGLNKGNAEPLALKRILCDDKKPLIVFESHLSGFNPLIKDFLNRLKNAIRKPVE